MPLLSDIDPLLLAREVEQLVEGGGVASYIILMRTTYKLKLSETIHHRYN